MTKAPAELFGLIDALNAHSLDVPEEVRGYTATVERLTDHRMPGKIPYVVPADMLDWPVDALVQRARARAVNGALNEQIGYCIGEVVDELTEQAIAVLRSHVDRFLDQLRPRFDPAARAVHTAAKAGVRPGMRPADVIGDDKLRKHWLSLPDHIAMLEEIAGLRMKLSEVLDVAPHPDDYTGLKQIPGAPAPRRWAAAFSKQSQRWNRDARPRRDNEQPQDRWLRLSLAAPLELVYLADIEAPAPPPLAATRGPLTVAHGLGGNA